MEKGLVNIFTGFRIGSRDWFQTELDDIFESKKRPAKTISYFYASWAGECPRWIQMNMNGNIQDEGIDAQGQRRMDNGNYMHTRYGDYFQNAGLLVDREPAFKKELDGVIVSGRGDLIIKKSLASTDRCMMEIKSINARKFKLIVPAPDHGDVLQWQICSKALSENDGMIFYENKDSQEIKYHFVKFSQPLYEEVINDFIEVDKHNKAETLIPRPSVCKNPRYCPLRFNCK